MNHQQAWEAVLKQLQKEMPRASFDSWVRDTKSISLEAGMLTVAAHNAYACDWLESRLVNTITRLLLVLLNANIKINFVVAQDLDENVVVDDEERSSVGTRIEAQDSTRYRDEVHPDHVVMLDGYALRLLEHGDMTPKEMSLWIGFRQAIFRQHKAGKGTIHNVPHYDVTQFAMMSRAAFFRELKGAKEIGGKKIIAGGHVEILPEDASSDSYANRYRVQISPLLTRHDSAVIESILLADIAMVATHDDARQAVLQTLDNLVKHDPADWINQDVQIKANQPQRIQDIVRRALELEGDFPEDLAAACEQVYDRIVEGFGKVFITHYFLRVVAPSLKLTHAQAWAIIILRDKCWFDHETGTQKNYAFVPGGLSTVARWVGVTGQRVSEWMQIPEFNAFVLVADRENLYFSEDWLRSNMQIICVAQQEPQISEMLEDGKVRLTWRKSETLNLEKRDSVLGKVRLGLRNSETLLNNLNITVFKTKNMGAPAPARVFEKPPKTPKPRKTEPTPEATPIEAIEQTPQTRVEAFPVDCQTGAALMLKVFNVIPPERPPADADGGDFALWINGIRALEKTAAEYGVPFENAMDLTHQLWNKSPFSVSHPRALKRAMVSALAQNAGCRSQVNDEPTEVEKTLQNFIPRGA